MRRQEEWRPTNVLCVLCCFASYAQLTARTLLLLRRGCMLVA
jgi:hypothetical protein